MINQSSPLFFIARLIFHSDQGSVESLVGAAMVVQLWWSRGWMAIAGITAKLGQLFKYLICNLCNYSDHDGLLSPSTPKVFILEPFFDISCISKEVSGVNARLVELKAFIRFLEEECGFTFDVNRFDHRIKLQKYVFISKFLGWNNGYDYNIYIRGPYSPDLASDYYRMNKGSISSDETNEHLPSFDKQRFTQVIQGKKIPWLEVGTTMLSLYDRYQGHVGISEKFLLNRTKAIKSDYDKDGFIERVLKDLSEQNLIGF